MSHKGRNRRRLIKLWLEDYRCFWCKRPTILVVVPPGEFRDVPDFSRKATTDHLYSRLDAQRGKAKAGVEQTVLACFECNQRRCCEEQKELPIEELHRRSGRHGR